MIILSFDNFELNHFKMYIRNSWALKDILYLSMSKAFNINEIKKIVDNNNSIDDFINSNSKQSNIFGNNSINEDILSEVDKQIELCEKNKVNIISFWDDNYPNNLKEIQYPPLMLFVKGEFYPNDNLCIAIVGTRHRSQYGTMVAEHFAEKFAKNGVVVVSGLASGIDTDSHMAVVKAKGITYAVIASGIDKLSPQLSVKNSERIVETGGAIVSEYRCGVVANLGSFPQRNRIISGMSKAIVVVESDKKGGSLITARMAIDENRDVYAVPGNIFAKTSKGTNQLIKNNLAIAANSPDDILNDLGFELAHNSTSTQTKSHITFNSKNEELIFNLINHEPIQIDTLLDKVESEIEISELLVKLLELEFKGYIRQLPGKYYVRLN